MSQLDDLLAASSARRRISMAEAVEAEANWGRRLLAGGGIAAVIVVAFLLASAAVPRWWAQRTGDRVDGSITQGVFIGLFYGFVFTFLALVVFIFVVRRGRPSRRRDRARGGARPCSPNLMTLGIVLGVGSGAHAGDRILDVDAPAFRGATLAGALFAGLLASYIWYPLSSRDRARDARRRRRIGWRQHPRRPRSPRRRRRRRPRRVWRNGPRRRGAAGRREARTQGVPISVDMGATEDAASRRSSAPPAAQRLFREPPRPGP